MQWWTTERGLLVVAIATYNTLVKANTMYVHSLTIMKVGLAQPRNDLNQTDYILLRNCFQSSVKKKR